MADDTLFKPEEGVTVAVIKRGELQSGDLLVLSHPGSVSDGLYRRLVDFAENRIGAGVKILLLEDGVKIEAILSRRGD